MMERRMKRKFHVRCGAGEKLEITSKTYLSQYLYDVRNQWFPIKQRGKSYIFIDKPRLNFDDKGTASRGISNQSSKEDKLQRAKRMQVNFGKYSGKTLEEIYVSDKNYFKYLLQNGRDTNLVNACRYINDRTYNN